jgi:3-phosphoglycerate kinase
LAKQATALWVGLMGDCSVEETQGGSLRVAQAVGMANRPIAVGDETVWATTYFGFDARIRLIQGGDAAIALLSGTELPGLAALAR